MQVTERGSVRVDLVGGTLDIDPISLILNDAVTLNVATSLEAEVTLESIADDKVHIYSEDYKKEYIFHKDLFSLQNLTEENFGPMRFVSLIIFYFGIKSGLRVRLKSGAPAGSGLGGSSAMGITLYKALSKFTHQKVETHAAVSFVKSIEGIILNQGMPGYQDYYPSLLGGILSLRKTPNKVEVEQLYSEELKDFLESNLTLVYSGISRSSGINNWDIYKKFFDKDFEVRSTLQNIAHISNKTYGALKNKNFDLVSDLISQEGELRKNLAPGIVPSEISDFISHVKSYGPVGFKMCGAGGGGCFLIVHKPEEKKIILDKLNSTKMKELPFHINPPKEP